VQYRAIVRYKAATIDDRIDKGRDKPAIALIKKDIIQTEKCVLNHTLPSLPKRHRNRTKALMELT
jgi:hypothetical protein